MTIRLSSGLRDAVITNYGLGRSLQLGHIRFYTGNQPASADAAATGALVGVVTASGLPVPTGQDSNAGLRFALGRGAGTLTSLGDWVVRVMAPTPPGWWRFVGAHPDDGAQSTYFARLDGAAGDSVQDMPALIASTTVLPVGGFLLSLPSE